MKIALAPVNRKGLCVCIAAVLLCGSLPAQKSKQPLSAETYYKRGLIKLENGKCEEAIKDFSKAIELKPSHSRSFLRRGQCFDELDEFENAIGDLTKAVSLNPRDYFGFLWRANLYAEIGKFSEAIADYTSALKLVPGDHDALSSRAEAYREIGEIGLAEADERKADKAWELLKKDPTTISPMAATIQVPIRRIFPKLLTEQDLADSYIRSIERSFELVPDSPEKIRKLAEDEIARLTKILRVNPQFTNAYFERGNNYSKLAEYDKAISDYSKAIELDPNHFESFNNRGIACARIGNYERAIADFTRALSIAPKDHVSLYNFGLVLLNKGLFEQAANILTSYIEKEPYDIKGYQLRAMAYRKLGKIAEAEADEAMAKEKKL